MDILMYWIGVGVTGLLLVYLLLGLICVLLKVRADSVISTEAMPALKPVPIPTRKQKTWLHKLLVFIFSVRRWVLVENWHYQLEEGVEIVIPAGFQFDGASIPRPFWALLSPTGLLLIPGLLHDYGYKHQQLWQVGRDGCPEPFQAGQNKDYWDALFKRVGDEVNGVFMVNLIAKLALAVGGSGSWQKHRRASVPASRPQLAGCAQGE